MSSKKLNIEPSRGVRVGVVDYQMGNLHSVAKALALQGANSVVSSDKSVLSSCDILLLPGVGAFGAAMKSLMASGLDHFVKDWVLNQKRPFLGFCLGLQLLFESSEESPEIPGLGIVKGGIKKFDPENFNRQTFRIPHMGWNTLQVEKPGEAYFQGLKETDSVYFVHTFYANPSDTSVVAAKTEYGASFCSAVADKGLFATQFHPEKSGTVGQIIISNALRNLSKEAVTCS